MNKKILGLITALVTALAVPSIAFADTAVCQPIYGGGVICPQAGNLQIEKKVAHPTSGDFVDNLSVSDAKFVADQTVTFELTVKNTGNVRLEKVTVKDIFPQHVNFKEGPGAFDSGSRTLTFDAGAFDPGQSKTFKVLGTVVPASQLPQDQGVACVINQAFATSDSLSTQDMAQLCVQRQVTKGGLPVLPPAQVPVTPPTGPEAIALIGLIPAGIFGQLLRKKSIRS